MTTKKKPFPSPSSLPSDASSSTPCGKGVSSIHRHRLTRHILVGSEHQDRLRHVGILPGTSGRDLALILFLGEMTLLVLVTPARCHLAREHAGRYGVDADLVTILNNLGGEHAREVVSRGLAGVVAEVVLGALDQATDTADVDHSARPVWVTFGRGLQQGEKGGGHEKDAGDIGAVCVGPVLESGGLGVEEFLLHIGGGSRLGGVGFTADARIVDQDTETLLTRLDLFDQPRDLFFLGYITGEGDDLPFDILVVLVDYVLELFFGAADDIDLRAVNCEGLSDHETDT